ncbi:predicted protein [Naegleria gruberi]|uniref:Predicted protein n=1 Tax=Naegleria gruberi TaxID=5762 RepID=D2V633_NAEGR|nr:uncharacterized protein NAEGRDRAFT_64294 [Naegleria gruberi]EFC47898.1 predicted protein [Naegleria gruberi]|eukprot:XP_002680642.1 predicted protein [Naegleria gruberi strain NEG-M]
MKTFILLACLLALCQLISCMNSVSVHSGVGGHIIGSPFESNSPSPKFTTNSIPTIPSHASSNIQSVKRSVKACTCSGCFSDTDINRKIYSFNSTCQDSRNFVGISFNLGSDNTQEMYQTYMLKNEQYKSLLINQPFYYFDSFYTNCLTSQDTTVYNSPSVITAYYCDSQISNATTCNSKYKHNGACYIGLNWINATSYFDSTNLKINIDLIGNDGKLWIRSASNIKVTVKGTLYSNSFTAKNSYLGSIVFTFGVPTTSDTYSISVEAENYFGVVTKDLVQVANNRNSANVVSLRGVVIMLIAMIVSFAF